jgi:hypothetical protein
MEVKLYDVCKMNRLYKENAISWNITDDCWEPVALSSGLAAPFILVSCSFSFQLPLLYVTLKITGALRYKPEGCDFETRWGKLIYSIYPNLSAALGSGVYSTSNRNEYQRRNKFFCGVERGRCVRLTTSPPSVSRLSGQCAIIDT